MAPQYPESDCQQSGGMVPRVIGGLEIAVGDGQSRYLSYLLRLWHVDGSGPVWRASLENPSSAERHGFATLEQLICFLRAETADLATDEAGSGIADQATESPLRQDSSGADLTQGGDL